MRTISRFCNPRSRIILAALKDLVTEERSYPSGEVQQAILKILKRDTLPLGYSAIAIGRLLSRWGIDYGARVQYSTTRAYYLSPEIVADIVQKADGEN
jgi:hypothetical protein